MKNHDEILKNRFITLMIFTSLFILLSSILVFAEETECPFGLVNDTAPGDCGLYNDENSNAICDYSEPHNCTTETGTNNPLGLELSGEELKTMTVGEVALTYGIDENTFAQALGELIKAKVSPTDSLLTLHDNNGLGMSNVKEIAASIAAGIITPAPSTQLRGHSYYLIELIIGTTVLYFITFILAKKDVFTMMTHRRIWNWILLPVFLAMAILSIILVINKQSPPGISLPINITFWHVELGIIMIIISLFHIWWHLRYYFPKKSVQKKAD